MDLCGKVVNHTKKNALGKTEEKIKDTDQGKEEGEKQGMIKMSQLKKLHTLGISLARQELFWLLDCCMLLLCNLELLRGSGEGGPLNLIALELN